MSDVYAGREQTQAKHFILRRYLQELAFKVLRGWDITYVDGFSGPWESQTDDLSDTSFMIAIAVLKDAQAKILEQTGQHRRIRCFFSETDDAAYAKLCAAVAPHHKPEEGFEIKTCHGKFEDAVPKIESFIGESFPLIFIDPTGWTGYPFEKIKVLFRHAKCEVLINFMYDFVNRFVAAKDESILESLNPILGGAGWRERLDMALPRGAAVEKLFRDTLQSVGGFGFVVSTKIDRTAIDRPHFFIAYGTKNRSGLKAFRETEYAALRVHAKSRSAARERKREQQTGMSDMFAWEECEAQEAGVDDIVNEQKVLAKEHLRKQLSERGAIQFAAVVDLLLQAFMLRETNVKDICVELAAEGAIENTWGGGNRKPTDTVLIKLS